jgi:hypothetical protein
MIFLLMENQLIQIYLFVCQTYDTSSETCFQRLSNNAKPEFTGQELLTIWFFAHLPGCFEKKKMHTLIRNDWRSWFPRLPADQTFVVRRNRLEPTFQTFGAVFLDALTSLPVMLAQTGHAYHARVAREIADVGYCAAKKTRFHGIRLHFIAQRKSERLPRPSHVWVCEGAHHDSKAFSGQSPLVPATSLFGDLAYPNCVALLFIARLQKPLLEKSEPFT